MEPYRWIADLSVIRAFESAALDLLDFYFTGDDYRYRIGTEAKRRFIADARGVQFWSLVQEKNLALGHHNGAENY